MAEQPDDQPVDQQLPQILYISDLNRSREPIFFSERVMEYPRSMYQGWRFYIDKHMKDYDDRIDRPPMGPYSAAVDFASAIVTVLETELILVSNSQSAPSTQSILEVLQTQVAEERRHTLMAHDLGRYSLLTKYRPEAIGREIVSFAQTHQEEMTRSM